MPFSFSSSRKESLWRAGLMHDAHRLPDPQGKLELRRTGDAQRRSSQDMLIIGCDFHRRFQQIAMLDGEVI
jgi:hypothetical protein